MPAHRCRPDPNTACIDTPFEEYEDDSVNLDVPVTLLVDFTHHKKGAVGRRRGRVRPNLHPRVTRKGRRRRRRRRKWRVRVNSRRVRGRRIGSLRVAVDDSHQQRHSDQITKGA
jgi:hypothetical protein